MFRRFILVLGALAASGWGACAAPLEAYGKLPSIERIAISPSGAFVASIVTNGEERAIAVQSTTDSKLVMVSHAGVQKIRHLAWAGDDHLIVSASTTTQPTDVTGPRVEHMLVQDLDLKKRRPFPLLDHVQGSDTTMNTVTSTPEVRSIAGKQTVFVRGWRFVDSRGQMALFRVDLTSHAADIAEPGGRGAYDWVVDTQGQTVAKALYNDNSGVWKLMVRPPSGEWRTVQTITAPIDTPDLMGMGRNDKSVLVRLPDATSGAIWRELSVESGTWGDPSVAAEEQTTIRDPASGLLVGTSALVGDEVTYSFFDAHDAAVWRMVIKAFPGERVTLQSWSDDRRKIIIRSDSAELGPAYALVDMNTGRANWLGSEYEGLLAPDISPVRPVRYKTADGLEISGYLTLPRGLDPRKLPLVVLPHGGPAARDTPGFDWWAQALASRGYAVLQVNFRGSAGYGERFFEAGFGEWGRKMQTDLSDGVRDLAGEGIVDPKRVCIVGASYGGYAALAGAALDHGVYRCAVSYAGPSDLRSQIKDSRDKGGLLAQRFWEQYIGAKDLNDPIFDRVSPLAHAADVDIPVLLIHGRDDTVVPIIQSRRMADALRRAGKPVELLELKGEDHWLSTGETRLAMLQAVVAFLEKNNPPNPRGGPSS